MNVMIRRDTNGPDTIRPTTIGSPRPTTLLRTTPNSSNTFRCIAAAVALVVSRLVFQRALARYRSASS
jgi:ABC-type uncharacterized transport system permease subunit